MFMRREREHKSGHTAKILIFAYAKRSIALPIMPGGRKVRATQSILLPNGKAPAAGDSKCHRK